MTAPPSNLSTNIYLCLQSLTNRHTLQVYSLLVINPQSGRWKPDLAQRLRQLYPTAQQIALQQLSTYDPVDCNTLIISGGDGTLRAALAWCYRYPVDIRYYPSGTFNEQARLLSKHSGQSPLVGLAGDTLFSYVLAAGIFTPIGYKAHPKDKQRWHSLAYMAQVLSQYRVHNLRAVLTIDGVQLAGTYSLIMIIGSRTCFRFAFNRMYDPLQNSGHILLIPSSGRDTLFERARLFFPLFRAFFVGFDKPVRRRSLQFVPFDHASIRLETTADWCADGEKVPAQHWDIQWVRATAMVTVHSLTKAKQTVSSGRGIPSGHRGQTAHDHQ